MSLISIALQLAAKTVKSNKLHDPRRALLKRYSKDMNLVGYMLQHDMRQKLAQIYHLPMIMKICLSKNGMNN